ncbi:hypothetical protein SSIG_07949 [Streptomyces filamentosus NRRL 11379]|nr:hypothetical protein SSIG_07949 [Streptomyces filamentosus NRRL 11379]
MVLTPVLSRPGAAAARNHTLRFQQTVDVLSAANLRSSSRQQLVRKVIPPHG